MTIKIINYLKSNSLLFRIINRLFEFYCTSFLSFFSHLISDPYSIRHKQKLYKKIKQNQLNSKHVLFYDRFNEIKEYFSLTNIDILKIFFSNSLPNSKRFKRKLDQFFHNYLKTDKKLKKAYGNASLFYALRLTLAYERYSLIIIYLDLIKANKPLNKLKVLDYGCGISDYGLFLASLGAKVTVVDLDNQLLYFAIWRYKKRNLPVKVIKVRNHSHYPVLKKSGFDLIIVSEVFEHVRDPMKLLQNIAKAIKPKGLLFDTMGTIFERELTGDHLKESIEIGHSKQYIDYHKRNFKLIDANFNYLYKKVG